LAGKWTRIKDGIEWRLNYEKIETASDWHEGGGTRGVQLRFEDGLLYHTYSSFFGCDKAMTGIYEVRGVPGEYIFFTVVDDACAGSRYLRGTWTAYSSQ
jgi:hypothetical protein